MTPERKALIELLLAYKRLPCLWDRSDPHYRNKKTRSKAMDILVNIYKQIQSDADAKLVKDKIENMRNSYRREWKKVFESIELESSGARVYVPTLWYYDYLKFLDEDDPLSLDSLNVSSLPELDNKEPEPKPITPEKQHLIDLIETFKSFSFLWDDTHQDYKNKPAREEAFFVLLEKYRLICSNANVASVKQKLSNLRTVYSQERKKVLASGYKYVPTIWFYPHMSFMEKVYERTEMRKACSDAVEICSQEANIGENEDTVTKEETFEVPICMNEVNCSEEHSLEALNTEEAIIKLEKCETIKEEFGLEPTYTNTVLNNEINQDNNEISVDFTCELDINDDSEMFGRTVGLNLRGLNGIQQAVAEKLIMDILYLGKIDELNVNSFIQLNEEPH